MIINGPIVFVDDDEDEHFLLAMALEELSFPYPPRFFSNGYSALEYLETTSEQPFAILCDINMPLMSGLEFRAQIDQNECVRKKAIPFLFMSTAAGHPLIEVAYTSNLQGFFQKPRDYDQLVEQLRAIIAYWCLCLHPNSP